MCVCTGGPLSAVPRQPCRLREQNLLFRSYNPPFTSISPLPYPFHLFPPSLITVGLRSCLRALPHSLIPNFKIFDKTINISLNSFSLSSIFSFPGSPNSLLPRNIIRLYPTPRSRRFIVRFLPPHITNSIFSSKFLLIPSNLGPIPFIPLSFRSPLFSLPHTSPLPIYLRVFPSIFAISVADSTSNSQIWSIFLQFPLHFHSDFHSISIDFDTVHQPTPPPLHPPLEFRSIRRRRPFFSLLVVSPLT